MGVDFVGGQDDVTGAARSGGEGGAGDVPGAGRIGVLDHLQGGVVQHRILLNRGVERVRQSLIYDFEIHPTDDTQCAGYRVEERRGEPDLRQLPLAHAAHAGEGGGLGGEESVRAIHGLIHALHYMDGIAEEGVGGLCGGQPEGRAGPHGEEKGFVVKLHFSDTDRDGGWIHVRGQGIEDQFLWKLRAGWLAEVGEVHGADIHKLAGSGSDMDGREIKRSRVRFFVCPC